MSKDQIAAAKLISATAYRVVGELLKAGLLKPVAQAKANARCQQLLRNYPDWSYDDLLGHCVDAYEDTQSGLPHSGHADCICQECASARTDSEERRQDDRERAGYRL